MNAATLFPEASEAIPAAAPDPSALFDPKFWFYDIIARVGLPYDLMKPCSCGSFSFVFITRGINSRDHHVYCERCLPDPRYRMSRPQDLIYAKLDVRTKVVTYTMPIEQILDLRKRIKSK